MKIIRIIVVFLVACLPEVSSGQYFQFSQYNFTPHRINPAQVGSSDYATLDFDFRNQATAGGFHLTSNILNLSYPLISRSGKRWSGIGISLMDDRSGQSGIFNTQEVGLSYALNVPLAVNQTISLGFKGVYQNRQFDLGGLFTGSQYVPDRGFSESLTNGENIGQFVSNYITFSAGLYWQKTDKQGTKIGYWGVSFFDFNKPKDSFMEIENELNATAVVSGGFRAYYKNSLSLFPELLFTRGAAKNVSNIGLITRYELREGNQLASHIDIITKYVIGRSGIVGLQFHRENFSIGFSYDFPIIVRNVANTGAFEMGVELRKLVIPKKKNKKPVKKATKKTVRKNKITQRPKVHHDSVARSNASDSLKLKIDRPENRSDSAVVINNLDSIKGRVDAGRIQHDPLILEKGTLNFGFEFNSSQLTNESMRYLSDLAMALKDNPALKIKLTGHTDNVGSAAFNLELSLRRAQRLRDFLIANGVPADKVSVEGKGMSEPLNNNKTQQQRAQNRRVELTILQH